MDFAFTDEQLAFKDQVVKFSQKEIAPLAEEYDYKGEWCWEAWKKMGEFGLLGLHFPEEYGGSGADVVTACLAGEALAEGGADGGLTLSWGAHTFLSADTIYQHGTTRAEEALRAQDGHGRVDRVHGPDRAERRVGRRIDYHERGQEGRPVDSQRHEDVHHQRPDCRRLRVLRRYRQGKETHGHLGVYRREGVQGLFRQQDPQEDGGQDLHDGRARLRGLRSAGGKPAGHAQQRLPDDAADPRMGPLGACWPPSWEGWNLS